MNSNGDSNSTPYSPWSRNTLWKQGSFVLADSFTLLEMDNGVPRDSDVQVVISHDCDLAEDDLDAEPLVEIMKGQIISAAAPDYTNAKSPNTLDLEVRFAGGVQTIRLKASRKFSVPKSKLSDFQPDSRFEFDAKALGILQRWLACRYRRSALPDALHSRLAAIRKTLQEIGNKSPHAIVGFYIDYDPDGDISDPDERYELWINVVYDHLMPDAKQVAIEAAMKIEARLERKFKTDGAWKSIDLRSCQAISDLDFSLYDAQTMKLYRLEHISLKHSARTED